MIKFKILFFLLNVRKCEAINC